jgi:hypothetical protein
MTSSEWHDTDESLLAELRAAVDEAASVPQAVVEAARGAFAWRDVDAELERLVLAFDSLREEDGALVRDAGDLALRTLVFDGDQLSLEVELGDEVEGQLIPPQPGRIELVDARGVVAEAVADSMGCFRLPRPDRGPVRLRCRTAELSATTEWVPL